MLLCRATTDDAPPPPFHVVILAKSGTIYFEGLCKAGVGKLQGVLTKSPLFSFLFTAPKDEQHSSEKEWGSKLP